MFKTLSSLLSTFFFFAVILIVVIISNLWRFSQSLPDYRQLEKYEPAVTTRLYAGDGQLLKEYAVEQRLFMPVGKIPDLVKQAFISAEDKKFYRHSGIDYVGIVRAVISNVKTWAAAAGRRARRPSPSRWPKTFCFLRKCLMSARSRKRFWPGGSNRRLARIIFWNCI